MNANIFKSLIFKTFSPFNDNDDINITMNAAAAAAAAATTTTTNNTTNTTTTITNNTIASD